MLGMSAQASDPANPAAGILPEPRVRVRPAQVPGPRGLRRLRAAGARQFWEWSEYRDSACASEARALRVSGSERHSGAPLSSVYFGSGNHLAYLLGVVYGDYRVEEERQALRAWQVRRWLRELGQQADLVLADLPWPYDHLLAGRGFLELPAWIDQTLPLPEHWQDVLSQLRSSARGEDLRKIRKQGLSCRLVRDEAATHRFYREMYVPHVTARFGEAAFVEPEWKVQYCAAQGFLREILRAGEVVAGQVLYGEGDALQFLWAGTVGGVHGEHSRGAFPALFYFGILHAFESGYRAADYCGSRPLLADGIFQLKRRWGGHVHDGWSRDTLFLSPTNLGPGVQGFLAGNPVITRGRDGLVGKVFLGANAAGPEDVAKAEQFYATGGLAAIRVCSLLPATAAALDAARARRGIELVDLRGEREPVVAYGQA